MKRLQAVLAAALVTTLVAFGMLVVGVNALVNPNSVPVNDTPGLAAVAREAPASDAQAQAQINQLQNLVTQYQGREKQYQTQIDQLNAQVQQFQDILVQLQQRGIIRLNRDGSIQLRRGDN